jgi:hypothetical protein
MWTQGAAEYSLRALEKAVAMGDDPREVIERSIGAGWTGLFPSKRLKERTTLLDATVRRQLERREQPPEQDYHDDE